MTGRRPSLTAPAVLAAGCARTPGRWAGPTPAVAARKGLDERRGLPLRIGTPPGCLAASCEGRCPARSVQLCCGLSPVVAGGLSGHRTPSSAPAASWQRPPANYSTSPTQRPTDYSPASETVSRTYSTKPASTTDPHCTWPADTLSDAYSTPTETDTAASLTRADSAAES